MNDLTVVSEQLKQMFPVDPELPQDMKALLDEIDRNDRPPAE